MSQGSGTTYGDGIDLVEIGRTLRRGWRSVVGLTIAGAALATVVVLFAPRRYESAATIVLKASDPSGSLLSKVGLGGGGSSPIPDIGSLGGLLGASMKSPLETEIQILQSRAVARTVMDSLLLQARVRRPAGIPTTAVVRALDLRGSFKRARYDVARGDDGRWHAQVDGRTVAARPGEALRFPQGDVVLRGDTTLPAAFQLELLDLEDATTVFQKRLVVSKAGGEVTKVSYSAGDPVTAARVPNAIVAVYLARRKTVDRGVNQHRAEFLAAQSDSVSRELSAAEHALRTHQERSGVLDAVVVGKVQVEQAALLRKSLGELDVEHGAVDRLIDQVGSGQMSARQLAAFPAFLGSAGIGELLKKLTEIEVERTTLLERRTRLDPQVIALDSSARAVEQQLIPLATAYRAALAKQRHDVASQLDTMRAALGVLPGAAESGNRLQRDVIRLGTIYAALQAQLVEARLAAIGEGGDVRQLDLSEPTKKPAFPRPLFTLVLGTAGGFALGILAAFLTGVLGRWADDPREIERHLGIPALRFTAGHPLLLAGGQGARTVLLVPLDARADTGAVADRLAQTAAARGATATIFAATTSPESPSTIPESLRQLELGHDLTIVRLPRLDAEVTAAALSEERPVLFVAAAGRVDRLQLAGAVDALRRLNVPCAGVVMSEPPGRPLGAQLRAKLVPAG